VDQFCENGIGDGHNLRKLLPDGLESFPSSECALSRDEELNDRSILKLTRELVVSFIAPGDSRNFRPFGGWLFDDRYPLLAHQASAVAAVALFRDRGEVCPGRKISIRRSSFARLLSLSGYRFESPCIRRSETFLFFAIQS
jgi:hypothetical protein